MPLTLETWTNIFEHAGWSIAIFTPQDFKFQLANPAFCRMHGYADKELVGKSLEKIVAPEFAEELEDYFKTVLRDGHCAFESIHLKKDGSRIFMLSDLTVVKGPASQIKYIALNCHDITDRKMTEQIFTETQERLQLVLSGAGMATWDFDCRSQKINRSENHGRLYGYEENQPQWSKDRFESVIHPDDRERTINVSRSATPEQPEFENIFRVLWPDASVHWLSTRGRVYFDQSGNPQRIIGVTNDITRLKETEQELTTAIQSRDEFLSVASHELKTPITSLKIQLQLAKRHISAAGAPTDKTETCLRSVDVSLKQVDRLTNLIEDLLDVSRFQEGRLEYNFGPVDLGAIVYTIAEQFKSEAEKSKIDLKINTDDEIFGLWDQSRIEQVVVNLLSNAIKYAPGKPISLSALKKDDLAILIVKDHGPGISKESQGNIFKRFQRAEASRNISGLGLGLFIAKQIVRAHGGEIKVVSEPGKGSEFIVELPLDPRKKFISQTKSS